MILKNKIVWRENMKKERINHSIWGICLLLFGIGIAGNAMKLWNFTLFFDGWWTLFIIIPCASGVLTNGILDGSLVGLVSGILLLLASRNIITFSIFWKIILPIILIVIGTQIIFRSLFSTKTKALEEKEDGVSVIKKKGLGTYIISAILTIFFLVVLGGVVTIASNGTSGINEIVEDTQIKSSYTKEFEGVKKLSVNSSDLEVEVEIGERFLVTAENVNDDFKVSLEDDTLVVKVEKWNSFFNFFSGQENSAKAVITIPEDTILEQAKFFHGSGDLTVNGIEAQEFTLDGGSGKSMIINCAAKEKASISIGSGSAVFENTSLQNANISSGSGNVSFAGSLLGNCRLSSGSGNVVYALFGDINRYKIHGEGGSGGIWMNGEKYSSFNLEGDYADYKLKIDGGSGRVVIDFKE